MDVLIELLQRAAERFRCRVEQRRGGLVPQHFAGFQVQFVDTRLGSVQREVESPVGRLQGLFAFPPVRDVPQDTGVVPAATVFELPEGDGDSPFFPRGSDQRQFEVVPVDGPFARPGVLGESVTVGLFEVVRNELHEPLAEQFFPVVAGQLGGRVVRVDDPALGVDRDDGVVDTPCDGFERGVKRRREPAVRPVSRDPLVEVYFVEGNVLGRAQPCRLCRETAVRLRRTVEYRNLLVELPNGLDNVQSRRRSIERVVTDDHVGDGVGQRRSHRVY